MARLHYYVSPHGPRQWKVHHEGKDYFYKTQIDAITDARTAATQSYANGYTAQVHVQRLDGRFRTEWTYGDDPPQYPG